MALPPTADDMLMSMAAEPPWPTGDAEEPAFAAAYDDEDGWDPSAFEQWWHGRFWMWFRGAWWQLDRKDNDLWWLGDWAQRSGGDGGQRRGGGAHRHRRESRGWVDYGGRSSWEDDGGGQHEQGREDYSGDREEDGGDGAGMSGGGPDCA